MKAALAAVIFLVTASFPIEGKADEIASCIGRALASGKDYYEAELECKKTNTEGSNGRSEPITYPREYVVVKPVCETAGVGACGAAPDSCPPGQRTVIEERYRKESATAVPTYLGLGSTYCAEPSTDALPALAAEEFLKLKPLVSEPSIQPPDGRTLVNFKTIFSTTTATQEIGVNLLGFNVVLRAIPATYHWDFGDGNTLDTDKPGRPYPAMDITHQYRKTGTFQVALSVTFRGEFTINGGPPQPIDGTISSRSSAVELTVVEARAELVAPPG